MPRPTTAGRTRIRHSRAGAFQPLTDEVKQGDGSAVSLINETAEPSPCFTKILKAGAVQHLLFITSFFRD